jgi:hypothetical protein
LVTEERVPPNPLPEKPYCFQHSRPLVALQEINPPEQASLCVCIMAALSIEALLIYDGIALDKSDFI